MEYKIIDRGRVLTASEASLLVGDKVAPAAPNVTEPCLVTDGGEPVLAYLPVPNKAELRRAVRSINYPVIARGAKIYVRSRTFGSSPRRPVYGREGCHQSSVMTENPAAGDTLSRWAVNLEAMLREFAPAVADRDRSVLDAVEADWRMGENNLWTSGVVNRSARLPYHRDTFNFPTWSAMPVLRRDMAGGYLSVPEYNLTVACRDGYAVFFPGHLLVHGVTPMKATKPDGYRYSVVYYALRGMKDCFTAALETEHAKKARTAREREMARKAKAGEPLAVSPILKRQRATEALGENGTGEEDYDPHVEAMRELRNR